LAVEVCIIFFENISKVTLCVLLLPFTRANGTVNKLVAISLALLMRFCRDFTCVYQTLSRFHFFCYT